ncbi:MAG: penicillin-binding protein 2, partial [Syntrophomonadaceae bacterium]|nr:penicillin-binding protein 2 [Syntrophomonadaceae bacterium]
GYHHFSDKLSISCWKEGGHGNVSVARAVAESCNSAFIQIGLRLGRARLLEFCHDAGFFSRDIIGYPGAQQGSKLDIDYGEAALGNASLGQKGVMMTPLQVANMVATVADNGLYKQPRLVKGVSKGELIEQQFSSDPGRRVMDTEVAQLLQEYLRMATTTGTGRPAYLSQVGSAGKTATSQTGRRDDAGEEILDTWFAGYFPADNPRWVIAVLVEHGQSGGYNAAPVFKEIAQRILGRS